MMTIDELDDKFGIEGELGFTETNGDLIAISIYNKYADAEICLYGGQITRYIPHGGFDLLWMSQASFYEEGKAIRGGIPICFPWFGPNPTDTSKPAHGFARLMYWEVIETSSQASGEIIVKLQLESSEETKALWPFDFCAILTIVIGRTLEVSLSVKNTGNQPFEYSAALHSYFNISGIGNILISGLEGHSYYNGFDNELQVQQDELLSIEKEENRRYIDTENDNVIIDPTFNQLIRVSKKGSKVTVVWNPGEETSATMEDMHDGGFQEFVCIEAVNAYHDRITLVSGETHETSTYITLDQKPGSVGLGESIGGFNIV